MGKSLVSASNIPAGTIITREMLIAKSPGDGIPPYQMSDIVGKTAIVDVEKDITLDPTWFT